MNRRGFIISTLASVTMPRPFMLAEKAGGPVHLVLIDSEVARTPKLNPWQKCEEWPFLHIAIIATPDIWLQKYCSMQTRSPTLTPEERLDRSNMIRISFKWHGQEDSGIKFVVPEIPDAIEVVERSKYVDYS